MPETRTLRCAFGVLSLLATSCTASVPVPPSPPHPPAVEWPKAIAGIDADTDGDGLSDYAELHKYFTDPRKRDTAGDGLSDGDWERRREFTYTLSAVVRLAKPADPAVMNDDYQDARVVAEDKDSYTVEVVYYPLNDNLTAIAENPNWKVDDAGMTADLEPSLTVNWDGPMQSDLLAALRADGIDPDRLTDRQVVERVSRWALRRARTTPAFSLWFVDLASGAPKVAPELRAAFDKEKPRPDVTDEEMFSNELLGREMFLGKVHGTCTSSATYLATLLRAVGIPTRTVVMIPPVDPNDDAQIDAFVSEIHHHKIRASVAVGLEPLSGSFANHLFNEVFVGHRWVRLNYADIGQNIVDPNYLGLMTHVATVHDVRELDLPHTWGRRYALGVNDSPHLSSNNPYMLAQARPDRIGKFAHVENPDVPAYELTQVTVQEVLPKDSPAWPDALRGKVPSDVLIRIKDWLPEEDYRQMSAFARRAAHDFVLRSPGHPDVRLALDGLKFSDGTGAFQVFGARVVEADRGKVAPRAKYSLEPINTSTAYRWTSTPGLVVRLPALLPR
jgi:transglutaminase-like putative cysteine protease